MTFKKGENRKYILIEINNDDTPEPDEMFEVILANPRDGAILGTPSRGMLNGAILETHTYTIISYLFQKAKTNKTLKYSCN